ncbi:MAG: putative apolipoprotein N-acyltransferase N-acyltransferase, rane protein [Pseudomonadota bacterium]
MQTASLRHFQSFAIYALLGVAGVLQAFALAWPFEGASYGQPIAALQLTSLAILAAVLDRSNSAAHAFFQAWSFASAWLLATFWWLFISLHTYGEMHASLAATAVLLLALALGTYYGLAGVVYRRWCHQGLSVFARALSFAALWMLAELLRGTVFTGFPWGAVGYAHVDSPIRHWLPWVGVYGVSALLAFACMLVAAKRAEHVEKPSRMGWGMRLVLLAGLVYTWSMASTQQGEASQNASQQALKVALVQGNVPQDLKFGAAVGQAIADYRQELLANTADFMALPETALPVLADSLPEHFWSELKQHFIARQQLALIGMPMREVGSNTQGLFTNSAVALMPNATAPQYRYDKHHLVPFGEFVPPMFRWFVDLMQIPLGSFGRGALGQPLLEFKGERIATNICYEDLFGEELAQNFSDPGHTPTLLINLSNIAWFGNTVAIDQHLHISRVRAMELGRPMLRATNTGATAIIDAQGVVTHRLASGVQGVLSGEVKGVHGERTPYTQWVSQLGLAPLWILGLATVLVAAALAHRARHGRRRFGP